MKTTCPQIYSALCDHRRIAAALRRASLRDIDNTAAAIQHALIWDEYSHGAYPHTVSSAVERHFLQAIGESEARIQPLDDGAPLEDLCDASSPLVVGRVVLEHVGCERTASVAEDIARAHAPGGCLFSPLPSDAAASPLFAACALASGLPGVRR